MKFTSTLLKQAWSLARQAAGSASPRPFFGWALKEVSQMTTNILRREFNPGSWAARLIGRDEQFGAKREFLPKLPCADGDVAFEFALEEGAVYEICKKISHKKSVRYFYHVENGQMVGGKSLTSLRDVIHLLPAA